MRLIFFSKVLIRIEQLILSIIIFLKKPLVLEESTSNRKIKFVINSCKEYFYRYKYSYISEKCTIFWIDKLIKKNDIVWDIGANVGAYSLLIGKDFKLKNGAGHVYAFEPESSNFFSLNKNIQINSLSDYITATPLAFSKQLNFNKFYLSSLESGSATHSVIESKSDGINFVPSYIQGIITLSIDLLIKKKNIPFPNHLKIDVDGHELEVIEGCLNTLKNKKLKYVIIEIAQNLSRGYVENLIISHGFRVLKYEEWNSVSGKIKNIIFVRKK
jgi:FkbM family methyltransferase